MKTKLGVKIYMLLVFLLLISVAKIESEIQSNFGSYLKHTPLENDLIRGFCYIIIVYVIGRVIDYLIFIERDKVKDFFLRKNKSL